MGQPRKGGSGVAGRETEMRDKRVLSFDKTRQGGTI